MGMQTPHPSNPSPKSDGQGIRYSSRLMATLQRFTAGLSVESKNPMVSKYGKAYDHLIAGDAHRFREEIEPAMAEYREAIELRDDFTEAYVGMARCLRRKGDSDSALQYFKTAIEHNPFDAEVQLELGKCYNETGNVPKAIIHFKRAVKLAPTSIDAKFGLALILDLNAELDDAAQLYRDVIKLDSEFVPAYNNLGSLYMRQGEYEKAERTFRHLVALAPDFSRGYLGLALTLDKAQKKREALPFYLKVLELKPNNRNAEYIEKRIIALNTELGRAKSTRQTTLVRVK